MFCDLNITLNGTFKRRDMNAKFIFDYLEDVQYTASRKDSNSHTLIVVRQLDRKSAEELIDNLGMFGLFDELVDSARSY